MIPRLISMPPSPAPGEGASPLASVTLPMATPRQLHRVLQFLGCVWKHDPLHANEASDGCAYKCTCASVGSGLYMWVANASTQPADAWANSGVLYIGISDGAGKGNTTARTRSELTWSTADPQDDIRLIRIVLHFGARPLGSNRDGSHSGPASPRPLDNAANEIETYPG